MAKKTSDKFMEDLQKMVGNRDQQRKLERIEEEINALMLGRKAVGLREAMSIWRYARLRTDLEKNDKDLSFEETVWKALFSQMDNTIEKNFMKTKEAAVAVASIQQKECEINTVMKSTAIQAGPEELGSAWQKMDEDFVKIVAYIGLHLDETSKYKQVMDAVMQAMKDAKDGNEVLKHAEAAQKVQDAYEESLITPLLESNDNVGDWLYVAERVVAKSKDVASKALLTKWFELARELSINRRKQSNAVYSSFDMDKQMIKGIIKNEGDMEKELPEIKEFMEIYALNVGVLNLLAEKTSQIHEELNQIAERLFGPTKVSAETITRHSPNSTHKQKFKLEFDVRRFLKTIFSMYGVAALLSFLALSSSDSDMSLLGGLALPIILLFEGGFIPALIIGFIVYCIWSVVEQRKLP